MDGYRRKNLHPKPATAKTTKMTRRVTMMPMLALPSGWAGKDATASFTAGDPVGSLV